MASTLVMLNTQHCSLNITDLTNTTESAATQRTVKHVSVKLQAASVASTHLLLYSVPIVIYNNIKTLYCIEYKL